MSTNERKENTWRRKISDLWRKMEEGKKEENNWSVEETVNGFFFGRRDYFIRRFQEQESFGQSRIRRTKKKRQKIFGELKYLVNQDGVWEWRRIIFRGKSNWWVKEKEDRQEVREKNWKKDILWLDSAEEENREARGGKFPKIQIIASWKRPNTQGSSCELPQRNDWPSQSFACLTLGLVSFVFRIYVAGFPLWNHKLMVPICWRLV